MRRNSYASSIGNLMYVMIYIKLNIAHEIEMVTKYMRNLGKSHWEAMNGFLDA